MLDTEINPFDEGTESPSVNETPEAASSEPVLKTDSTAETTVIEPTDPKVGEEVAEGKEVSEKVESEEISEEKRKEIESDAERRLADENSPKWFKNYVKNVYEPNLQKANLALAAFEPIKSYGEVEKVTNDLEMLKGLEATVLNPVTNLPEKTVRPFVENLIKTRGIETGIQVLAELGLQPSPATPGLNLVQELVKTIGLDPTRIEDYKKFAANGYQIGVGGNPPNPEELEQIPENLREAFSSLSETERFEVLEMDESARDKFLNALQFQLDSERKEAENKQSAAAAQQAAETKAKQEFYQDLDNQTLVMQEESGMRLTNTFVETLVKDASLEKHEALGITLLINSAINGSGAEGKMSLEILKEQGIELDPKLPELLQNWNTECRNAAYYKKIGDEKDFKSANERITELESQMCSKANPVVAHYAKKQAETNKTRIEQKNAALTESQKFNTGIKPNEGTESTIGIAHGQELTPAQREAALNNPFA